MRAAPAVELTVAPDLFWRVAVSLLAAAAGAGLMGWALLLPGPLPWRLAVPAACLPWLLWLVGREWRAPPLQLRWDGQGWCWREAGALPQAPEHSGSVDVIADFGAWMLLRLRPSCVAPRRWLAIGRTAQPARWHALRCAVYSPTPQASRRDASSPVSHER